MLSMPQVSGKETRSQNKRKNREKEDEDQQEQEAEELHEEVEKVEDNLKCVGFNTHWWISEKQKLDCPVCQQPVIYPKRQVVEQRMEVVVDLTNEV
jgi:hypothetical protein